MTAPPRLLQKCFQEALTEAPELLRRCMEAAIADLQTAENQGEEMALRDRLAKAWWCLLQNKAQWGQTFPLRLREAFDGEPGDSQLSRPATLSESVLLSLVDEDAVNESLESARLLQSIQPMVEQELAVLDALMSSLIGLGTVRAELNPMRPTVFVRALRDMMSRDEPDPEMRGLWLRHMGPPLGRELKKLYAQLGVMLQRANVREAGYRVRLSPEGRPSRLSTLPEGSQWGALGEVEGQAPRVPAGYAGHSQPAYEMPPMSQLGRLHSDVQHQVFHDFLEHGHSHFEQPLERSYYRQVERELQDVDLSAPADAVDEEALYLERTQYRDVTAVDRPVREVGIGSELSPQAWGDYAAAHERSRLLLQLKQKAQKVSQAVGLDVVRTLVNQVAQDPLLLAPVREAVVALEPALLRQALANPRFFSEDEHPARRLVESVAQRSFKYNDEFASEFDSFFQPVQQTFRTLNDAKDSDATVFAEALEHLEQGWEAQDQADLLKQEQSLQSVRHAEERQALADQIAWDLSQRPDIDNAPGVILDFLFGPWSLVIASAQLSDQTRQPDPGGYRKAVSNLLWSVKKEVTLKRPAKLFEIIPQMLSTLHSGLDMLGQTREETKPFFDALMRLHEPVLGLRRARIRNDASASGPVPLEFSSMSMELDETLPATPEQRKPRRNGQPWLGRQELDAAGFEDTLPTDYADLAGSTALAQPAQADEPDAEHAGADEEGGNVDSAAILASLREGDWVDLFSRREWLRAQLIWASSKGTLFMFVSRGGRPHSMTKRSCERLIATRLLRPIESRGVVQKALTAIARDASQNREAQPA
jgi:hypothetical protein